MAVLDLVWCCWLWGGYSWGLFPVRFCEPSLTAEESGSSLTQGQVGEQMEGSTIGSNEDDAVPIIPGKLLFRGGISDFSFGKEEVWPVGEEFRLAECQASKSQRGVANVLRLRRSTGDLGKCLLPWIGENGNYIGESPEWSWKHSIYSRGRRGDSKTVGPSTRECRLEVLTSEWMEREHWGILHGSPGSRSFEKK